MDKRNERILKFLGYSFIPENSKTENMAYTRTPSWINKNMDKVNKNIVNLPKDFNINDWYWGMLILNKIQYELSLRNINDNCLDGLKSIMFSKDYYNSTDKVVEEEFIVKHNNIIVHSNKKTVELTNDQFLKIVNDKKLEDFLNEAIVMINKLEIIEKWEKSGFLNDLKINDLLGNTFKVIGNQIIKNE